MMTFPSLCIVINSKFIVFLLKIYHLYKIVQHIFRLSYYNYTAKSIHIQYMENILDKTIDNGVIENVQIAPIGTFNGSRVDGSAIEEKNNSRKA